jgi:hypothetical protein
MKNNWIRVGVVALQLCLGLTIAWSEEAVTKVNNVTFQKGKVLYPDQGNMVEATNDLSVATDVLVHTNGVFTVKKGKDRQLQEGQTIDASGMLTSPDGSVVPVVDHLIVKGGRVLLVRDGKGAPLSGEFALPDGSRVTPSGSIKGSDGRLRRMLDGQLLKPDGSSVPVTDTVSLKDGKVVLYKDGGHVELRRGQIMAMSDGTRVNGDGTVMRPDGTKTVLKEGELIKLPGVIAPR